MRRALMLRELRLGNHIFGMSSPVLARLRASFCSGRASFPVSGFGRSTTRAMSSSWGAPTTTSETPAARNGWAAEGQLHGSGTAEALLLAHG